MKLAARIPRMDHELFCMTVLALVLTAVNAVSSLHGGFLQYEPFPGKPEACCSDWSHHKWYSYRGWHRKCRGCTIATLALMEENSGSVRTLEEIESVDDGELRRITWQIADA